MIINPLPPTEELLSDINELVKKVGSPSYIKTPIFQKVGKNEIGISNAKRKRDKERERLENQESWERIKKFHPTKIPNYQKGNRHMICQTFHFI